MNVVIFEPELSEIEVFNSKEINDLDEFKKTSDVININRMSKELNDVNNKTYTHDLCGRYS